MIAKQVFFTAKLSRTFSFSFLLRSWFLDRSAAWGDKQYAHVDLPSSGLSLTREGSSMGSSGLEVLAEILPSWPESGSPSILRWLLSGC